jgi:hypothetical protein
MNIVLLDSLKQGSCASGSLTIAIEPEEPSQNQLDETIDECFRMMGCQSSAGATGRGESGPDQYQSLIDVALGVVHPNS